LKLASEAELMFMRDWPYSEPHYEMWKDLGDIDCEYNVLFLLKPDWIIGDIKFNNLKSGRRAGTFSIQPRVNFACIELYVSKERSHKGIRRLASGTLVSRSRPLDSRTYLELPEVRDCIASFYALVVEMKRNFQRIEINGDVYLVSNADLNVLNRGLALPPFPYMDDMFLS
jgi:hypothetical protein